MNVMIQGRFEDPTSPDGWVPTIILTESSNSEGFIKCRIESSGKILKLGIKSYLSPIDVQGTLIDSLTVPSDRKT